MSDWKLNTGKIYKHWADKTFGGIDKVPEKLLVIDCETTGLSAETDRVAQIGCTIITGDKHVSAGMLLETPMSWFSPDALRVTGFKQEDFDKHAVPRDKGLTSFHKFYTGLLDEDYIICGQNLVRFDFQFLTAEFQRLGLDFVIPRSVIDTGIIVKAAQIEEFPEEGCSFTEYLNNVSNIYAKGIKWNLRPFCMTEFKLLEMLSEEQSQQLEKRAHDACFDTLAVYLLVKRFREYAAQVSDDNLMVDSRDPDILYNRLTELFG